MSDDEIIDAEIVDDDEGDHLLPAIIERLGERPEIEGFTNLINGLVPQGQLPGHVLVDLSFEQRQVIRAALANYHDKGPRDRSTGFILATLTWIADHEPSQDCAQCDNTGKYRTMHGMYFCYCPRGVERRHNESQ